MTKGGDRNEPLSTSRATSTAAPLESRQAAQIFMELETDQSLNALRNGGRRPGERFGPQIGRVHGDDRQRVRGRGRPSRGRGGHSCLLPPEQTPGRSSVAATKVPCWPAPETNGPVRAPLRVTPDPMRA
jgi:hypothetical protein